MHKYGMCDLSKEGYNYVMLDVDGVLTSHRYQDSLYKAGLLKGTSMMKIEPNAVRLLKELCTKGNCRIVLTSIWKDDKLDNSYLTNENSLYKYLIDELEKEGLRIYDVTPDLNRKRPLEVAYWISMNFPDVEKCNFVILDDDDESEAYNEINPTYGKRLVKTSMKNGLLEHHVNEALSILSKNK